MLFRTIGMLEVSDSAQTLTPSADKPRRLLLLLLLRANRWVPDSELVDVVWPDGAPASAAGNIKSYVSQLRAVLGPVDGRATRIDRQPGAYRLNAGRDEIDSMIFEDLVELGRGALDPGHAVKLLTEALDLWRGTPYEQLDVEQVRPDVARLVELRWVARHRLATASAELGDHTAAIAALRAMTVDDPLREQTWLSLMTVLHASGRRAEALAAYQDVRRALVDGLGIEPNAELRDLHEKLLRDDIRPVRRPVPVREPERPAGLRRRRRRVAAIALAVVATLGVYVALIDVVLPGRIGGPGTVPEAMSGPDPGAVGAEFTGDRVPDGWTVNGPWPSQGDGHYVRGNVASRDGMVVITGSVNGDTGHFWRAADARSGRVEARVRIPRGCDCHRPGFSLWSVTGQQQAGEIVFLEAPGGDRQTARFAVHHPDRASRTETRRVDLTAWNTVAVEWSPGRVSGFLNGERWFHTEKAEELPVGALRPTFKMDWLGAAEPTTSTVEIDWIRVVDGPV